jgi:hypothetical protein
MIILLNDILPSKTSQRKFSSVLEPYAVKVASTVLRGECHCEVMFLPDIIIVLNNFIYKYFAEVTFKFDINNYKFTNTLSSFLKNTVYKQ